MRVYTALTQYCVLFTRTVGCSVVVVLPLVIMACLKHDRTL
jgi:hypothetical protein